MNEKIPLCGHLIWVGPHDPPIDLMNTWTEKNPKLIWTVWRDHKTKWENQDQINRMAVREWNGVADLMRHEILWRCGGICVDADSECLRPLDQGPLDLLANDKAFVFAENEHVRPGILGCGIMGAPRGSKFFRECVDRAKTKDMSKPAWTIVGPLLVTEVAKALPDEVTIYPAKWAHPIHYSGAPAQGVIVDREGMRLEGEPLGPYGSQKWGGTKGYNQLRKQPCRCVACRSTMLPGGCPWM